MTKECCDVCGTKRKDLEQKPWWSETGFICVPCETNRQQEEVIEFQNTNPPENFYGRDDVKCPHCGYEYDPDEPYGSGLTETECVNCDSAIEVEVEYTTTYSTSKGKK